MALSRLQRAVLISVLAAVVGWSLVSIASRTMQPAMPDQVVFQPPPSQPRMILVGVAGAVARPGLYWLPEGATVADALRAAGGTRADADLSRLNLSQRVYNNQMVNVLSRPRPPEYRPPAGVITRRVSPARIKRPGGQRTATRRAKSPARGSAPSALPPGWRININTASAAELERLPGIGPALARRIIQFRSYHGPFHSLQDLQAVKGIGPKKAAQIAPYITF